MRMCGPQDLALAQVPGEEIADRPRTRRPRDDSLKSLGETKEKVIQLSRPTAGTRSPLPGIGRRREVGTGAIGCAVGARRDTGDRGGAAPTQPATPIERHRHRGRSGLKNSTISRASASGCSIAAKWPPRGITLQRRMSLYIGLATERGGCRISRGNCA